MFRRIIVTASRLFTL